MDKTSVQPIDYKTHMLIGIRANGVMTVIRDWPHVPRQAEVHQEMKGTRDGQIHPAMVGAAMSAQVGELAQAESHHPDIAFGWGYVTIALQTKKIKGLHENDFIMAAKIDRIFDR